MVITQSSVVCICSLFCGKGMRQTNAWGSTTQLSSEQLYYMLRRMEDLTMVQQLLKESDAMLLNYIASCCLVEHSCGFYCSSS
jgi:hypothetical protein